MRSFWRQTCPPWSVRSWSELNHIVLTIQIPHSTLSALTSVRHGHFTALSSNASVQRQRNRCLQQCFAIAPPALAAAETWIQTGNGHNSLEHTPGRELLGNRQSSINPMLSSLASVSVNDTASGHIRPHSIHGMLHYLALRGEGKTQTHHLGPECRQPSQ